MSIHLANCFCYVYTYIRLWHEGMVQEQEAKQTNNIYMNDFIAKFENFNLDQQYSILCYIILAWRLLRVFVFF